MRMLGVLVSAWAAGLGLSLPAASAAHDFWIEATPMSPTPGQGVALRFSVGEQFLGEDVPYRAERARRFEHHWAGGREDLLGQEGRSPAASFRPASPGIHLIAYVSSATPITLPADAFNQYLHEEGLEEVLDIRRREGVLGLEGRERFARFAKALVVSEGAPPGDSTATRVLGLELEIVPEFDPVRLSRSAAPAVFRVLFRGRPLPGAMVFAMPESSPLAGLLRGVTDARGRVAFRFDRPGTWMIKLVHMEPCLGCADADWESSWASLVFTAASR